MNDKRDRSEPGEGIGPIVSSAHLVSERAAELSELEFGLTIANNAFQRWMVRCMAASGVPDLSPLDVLVLHSVNHRDRAKKFADICLVLNIEDTHVVTYALKKLEKLGLVRGEKKGKEKIFTTTSKGRQVCVRYREIREQCLVNSLSAIGSANTEIGDLAGLLRALSGLYDQAARAAASL
ncbi:MAG: winged helix DNA-binding protein [Alphaproteobacteria bacterium]|nr:winged helix DNA-binding protein [Alphaproteobacteria bacterium]